MNRVFASIISLLVSAACCAADIPAENGLTPIGAEQAGNAAGTIPAWTGGLTTPPDSYLTGYHETDPFPGDEPLLQINASNAEQYAQHLSPGQQALLARYPDTWHMNVYQSRRTASFPDFVYEAIARNAKSARVLLEGRGGVEGARVSSPFPRPTTGVEVVWNHNLRFRGLRVDRIEGSAAVTRGGRYTVVLSQQDWGFPYGLPQSTPFTRRYPNVLLAVKSKVIEPALLSGDGTLVFDTINQTGNPRKVWVYPRSLRRVVRSPFFGYQIPANHSDGLRTVDDFSLYNGPPDRYEWTLIGKQELYIPYNAYRLHGPQVGHTDIVRAGHINPDHARYELHRVWVVEGRLKEGTRHIYGRRVFYVDEDSWQIAVADSYNTDGELWRVNEAHAINYYTVPVLWSTLEVYHDLLAGRVLVNGLDNRHRPYVFRSSSDPREFSPNALIYYLR
ncbi:MAG: DUF1329 domain-containing protein [Gammaproteobacteria bacterium]|nr:MAG: DUF1329 domain-containing protein [Gammaproteobacteria bacterium]HDY83735.1 DUF1329 domain-containing protein [Halieaceae bacterium]